MSLRPSCKAENTRRDPSPACRRSRSSDGSPRRRARPRPLPIGRAGMSCISRRRAVTARQPMLQRRTRATTMRPYAPQSSASSFGRVHRSFRAPAVPPGRARRAKAHMEASITLKVQSEAHGAVGPDGVRRSTQVTKSLDLVPVVPRVTVGGVQFPSPTPAVPMCRGPYAISPPQKAAKRTTRPKRRARKRQARHE